MIVVWGSKLYGKVDEIEGVGHVATKFGHLFWIPLIPMGSYFVTEEERHTFEGAPIGLNWKSVLVGYGRVFSVLFFLCGLAAINTLYNPTEVADPEKMTTYYTMLVLGGLSIPLFVASYAPALSTASYERATELANTVGLDERLCTYIEYCYDKISTEEAEQRMEALESGTTGRTEWQGDEELSAIYQRYMSAS